MDKPQTPGENPINMAAILEDIRSGVPQRMAVAMRSVLYDDPDFLVNLPPNERQGLVATLMRNCYPEMKIPVGIFQDLIGNMPATEMDASLQILAWMFLHPDAGTRLNAKRIVTARIIPLEKASPIARECLLRILKEQFSELAFQQLNEGQCGWSSHS